ncbi:ADP-ribosylation factor-binding protein GGA1 isoform X2 [Epargyreus clarus]|uniref:ADP-ribosylation factor-binding protein GGA1 isoform X2 n=1 Tax=Epargyreus clarus TaxID=520877 RepID=UPI003C30BE00
MNVTLTSLEALILKATHESLPQPDDAAVEAFCTVMRDAPDGPLLAAQALAARMQSLNSQEAMLALVMLDRCMRRCDASFHAEIGKFRFLNEMIKLVSPKYYADRTSAEVRTRVLQLLHAWSIEYPNESKFKVAFDMLKNQGVITGTPPPLPPEDPPVVSRPRAKSAVFEDEEKSKLLQKLLQSKKPEDLQHANKLIKTMVREEERRNEANSRRAKEVGAALDSAELLQDMLDHAYDASPEEEQLMEELYATCMKYRPILERMAYGNTQASILNQILLAGDVLDDVVEKYDIRVMEKKRREKLGQPSLLDFAGAMSGKDDTEGSRKAKNVLEELGIYDQRTLSCAIVELLKPMPQNLMETHEEELLPSEKEMKAEGWDELDVLGEQLLKQALPENAKRAESFNGKPGKKIPMNALEKSSPKHNPQPSSNGAFFDLDFFNKPTSETLKPVPIAQTSKTATTNDDVMVDISINAASATNASKTNGLMDMLDLGAPAGQTKSKNQSPLVKKDPIESLLKNKPANEKSSQMKNEVKPLTDIFITLPSVQPSTVPSVTAFEEQGGLSVVLHFCKNKPRPDVNVIVISTTSKNSSPITEYKFQAVVPKSCKVRLLSPSASSLPAYNPFLPPPALTQMMLVARPPGTLVNLKFVLTYTCNDEMCSEMGEVDSLPLDQI